MIRSVFLMTIACFFILSIQSCKNDETLTTSGTTSTETQKTGPFPLKVGNTWTYKISSFDAEGKSLGTSGQVIYHVTLDTTVLGEKWYYLESNGGGLFYFNRTNGVWNFVKGTMQPFFKYPSTKNAWYSTNLGYMIILSTDTNLTVPKGTFSCYQYRLVQSTPMFDYYFATGVGIVGIDFFSQADSIGDYVATRYELVDYTLQ
jgi:hypothetical protein